MRLAVRLAAQEFMIMVLWMTSLLGLLVLGHGLMG